MRVIGGTHKGRRILPPELKPTRPTTDFAREGLYNILYNNWELDEITFLDLFSGTGAHALEMASRGCEHIVAIDSYTACTAFLKSTAEAWGINSIQAITMDVFRYLGSVQEKFDIVFADPPFAMENVDLLPDIIIGEELLTDEGWFILEHAPDMDFSEHPNYFHERKYGSARFSFFRYKP